MTINKNDNIAWAIFKNIMPPGYLEVTFNSKIAYQDSPIVINSLINYDPTNIYRFYNLTDEMIYYYVHSVETWDLHTGESKDFIIRNYEAIFNAILNRVDEAVKILRPYDIVLYCTHALHTVHNHGHIYSSYVNCIKNNLKSIWYHLGLSSLALLRIVDGLLFSMNELDNYISMSLENSTYDKSRSLYSASFFGNRYCELFFSVGPFPVNDLSLDTMSNVDYSIVDYNTMTQSDLINIVSKVAQTDMYKRSSSVFADKYTVSSPLFVRFAGIPDKWLNDVDFFYQWLEVDKFLPLEMFQDKIPDNVIVNAVNQNPYLLSFLTDDRLIDHVLSTMNTPSF